MSTKKQSKPNRASVIDAFLGTTWAIEPKWLDNAWAVLQKAGDTDFKAEEEAALRTRAGTRPDGTFYTVVPENSRTAIIEIWGAIFPRANYITHYSGGTSCELLASDIRAAQENPHIDNILFLIHSPGGDVVGVTDVVDAIRDFRAAGKRTTAYVRGYAASAAYWIASTCDRIVAARTAQLGSIGVYSVYVDDTEQLKMRGLSETTFTATQSPDKNADPNTERGKQLIQTRIDDLCDVFLADVAENMKVSVETVAAEFGKGDMLVAARAVEKGLCHEIGSFPQAVSIGAKSAGELYADDDDDYATLNSADDIHSQKSAESDSASDNHNLKEEKMAKEKEEKESQNPAASAAGTEETTQPAASETTEKPSAKTESNASNTSNASEATLRAMQEKNDKMQARIEALEAEALEKDLTAQASAFVGETAKHVSVMQALVSASGRDSAVVKDYIELQTAAAAQQKESALFGEQGKTGAASDANGESAFEKLKGRAAEIAKAENISSQKAFVAACERNKELYAEYTSGN